MKKHVIIVIVLLALTNIFGQYEGTINIPIDNDPFIDFDQKVGLTGNFTLSVVTATFADRPFSVNYSVARADTGLVINNWNSITNEWVLDKQWYPAMLSVPINENETKSLYDYLRDGGSLSFYDLLKDVLPEYMSDMTREKINLTVNLIKNPERDDGLWIIGDKATYGTNIGLVVEHIIAAVENYYYAGYLSDPNNDFGKIYYCFPQVNYSYTGSTAGVMQINDNFHTAVGGIAHEYGHTHLGLGDTGNSFVDTYWYTPYYDAYIDGNYMGRSFTVDSPYNPMFHNGAYPSPYAYYGLAAFHTNDLIRQGYIDEQDVIEINDGQNKTEVTLKAVRNKLEDTERANDIRTALRLPISIDSKTGDSYRPSTGSGVESQHFLIEYRNGEKWDEMSPLWHKGESKGILITHIINGNSSNPTMDIEVATPYPKFWSNGEDLYRNPDSTRAYKDGTLITSENGNFYNGKEELDYLDDVSSFYHQYRPLGGKYAYWRAATAWNAAGLPTDFFTSSAPERNKFTPSTVPSTQSWKLKDTHVAVYMNNEDGQYADVTVYRNYWSRPISDGTSETIQGEGYIGENFSIGTGATLNLDVGSNVSFVKGTRMVVGNSSVFKLLSGSSLTIPSGCYLYLNDGSELTVEEGANLVLEAGARVQVFGNAKIRGNINQSYARIAVSSNSSLTLSAGSSFDVKKLSVSTFIMNLNSKLIVDTDSYLNFDDGALADFSAGSEIIVRDRGHLVTRNLNSDRVAFSASSGQWKGITCEVGGIINIDGASISGAVTGILGTPYSCTIKNSSIYNCSNGIELINCSNYNIEKNTITGNNTGVAVRLATSNGSVRDNTLRNFSHGLVIILCSPVVTKNLIRDNTMNGIYINGNNAYPYLVDDLENKIIVNNEVVANGIYTYDERDAQIRLVYPSNAYMYYGMNNIYFHDNAPAIYAQSNMTSNDQMKSLTTPYVRIPAQYNYWGTSVIDSENVDDIFNLWMPNLQEGYRISYTDYSTKPFPDDGLPITTLYGDMTLEAKMLAQAIKAENAGRIDLAIKKYEKLIDRYPDSEENYIAVTRLTDILAEQEEPLDQLMALYEGNIMTGDETVNKRFYKEMKVAASIKSKKYNEAITLAEELKAQALNENDVLLANLDISIATMMKEAESNNKGNAFTNFSDIITLTDKISGDTEKIQPADITECNIPKENALYQNYPNPFNPVTQIRFALTKTANVKLNVYNIAGQQVAELASGVKNAGFHTVAFDGSRYNTGVYYYTLEVDGKSLTQKMILMK